MKLDKRIIEDKKPLDCFDTDVAKQFIGKNGYFADNNYAFIDITSDDYPICYATLTSVDEFQRIAFYDNFDVRHYYFLPEEWVIKPEKKYRPFTLSEWIEQHEIGDIIHFRSKSDGTEIRHMYLGTWHKLESRNGYVLITLGDSSYSLEHLFEDYEIEVNGEWIPFGVEVEEE